MNRRLVNARLNRGGLKGESLYALVIAALTIGAYAVFDCMPNLVTQYTAMGVGVGIVAVVAALIAASPSYTLAARVLGAGCIGLPTLITLVVLAADGSLRLTDWSLLWAPAVPGALAIGLTFNPKPPEGYCPACGYDLRGTPSGPCPECGAAREVKAA